VLRHSHFNKKSEDLCSVLSEKGNNMTFQIEHYMKLRHRQKGGLTVFTAIMVLVILTLMIFYAVRVGLFSQRISANDVRQKTAFNAAEAGTEQGIQYLLENSGLILSSKAASGAKPDGWFATGKEKWQLCPNPIPADHQCEGMKPGSYFYGTGGSSVESILPIGTLPGFDTDVTVRLSANLCFVTLADPDAANCLGNPGASGTSSSYMIITLLSYGFSDCTIVADVSTCSGRATVAKPIANYKQLAGAPSVPLVSKSTFPPNGTANVAPNPNGGGVGVPISVWVNVNPVINVNPPDPYCPQTEAGVLSRGTWNTCELEEWYKQSYVPSDVACEDDTRPMAKCGCKTIEESISYANAPGQGNIPHIGIDIVPDSAFPCDLFQVFFNTPRADYEIVKLGAKEVTNCGDLGPSSTGILWITDTNCKLNNAEVGTYDDPDVLISEVDVAIAGQVSIFGVLYIFDGVNGAGNVSFTGAGRASVYGSVIVDADLERFNGTIDVVYSEAVLLEAAGDNGFGAVNGGWRDFGLPELAW
jgi:hypothetical protein